MPLQWHGWKQFLMIFLAFGNKWTTVAECAALPGHRILAFRMCSIPFVTLHDMFDALPVLPEYISSDQSTIDGYNNHNHSTEKNTPVKAIGFGM